MKKLQSFGENSHKCEADVSLSYDIAVNQWLTSCHKHRMTTRYITLG